MKSPHAGSLVVMILQVRVVLDHQRGQKRKGLAVLSITLSILHHVTRRQLRRSRHNGIFRQISSSQDMSSNCSNAKDLEIRHPNSFPVMRT